jgi:hypothetical protein
MSIPELSGRAPQQYELTKEGHELKAGILNYWLAKLSSRGSACS